MNRCFVAMVALIYLFVGNTTVVAQDVFPVTPTLFIENIFQGAEGIAFNGEGKLFVTANRSFWRIDPDGKVTFLTELHSNLGVTAIGKRDLLVADFGPTNRFNHGPNSDGIVWRITPEGEKKIAAQGGMGDPNFILILKDGTYLISDDATDEIFFVTPKDSVGLFTDAVGHPNGMVMSMDDRTLYVAQIFTSLRPFVWDNRIWAIPLDRKGNIEGIPEIVAEFDGDFAGPDGLAIDTLGRLYATLPRRGEIWRIDPKNHEKLLIAEGMPGIAGIAFGQGEFDSHTLYGASTMRGGGKIWKIDVGIGGYPLHR